MTSVRTLLSIAALAATTLATSGCAAADDHTTAITLRRPLPYRLHRPTPAARPWACTPGRRRPRMASR